MKKKSLAKLDFKHIEPILQNPQLFFFLPNEPLSICDPYYTEPWVYIDDSNIDWDDEYDKCNAFYEEEIKQDTLRYPMILEMLELKKELEKNPIIYDKEQEYYETDPHKLVAFDEYMTPFFEFEANEWFFRNLTDPIRLKWEEIPEEDRKQKIVHFEESVRKLTYDETEVYFNQHIISKDVVILFVKYIQKIWFLDIDLFKDYLIDKNPLEIHEFFLDKFFLLSSKYKVINQKTSSSSVNTDNLNPLTLSKEERTVIRYINKVMELKNKYWKSLVDCLKPDIKPEEDILTNFINTYDLLEAPKNKNISRVYNYKEGSKIVLLLNLSFFNIFPIDSNEEFEKIRSLNKPLFVTFLWYLKDMYWEFYSNMLSVKKDIKTYFEDETEYNKLANLIVYYPIRMVHAKEFFFTHHNLILREVVIAKLDAFYKAEEAQKKEDYRFNADFYILNQELQAFEKVKEKIRAKFRKEKKTQEQIDDAIDFAYTHHLRRQQFLDKKLFKRKSQTIKEEKPVIKELVKREFIKFFCDETEEETVVKTYEELINESLPMFIETLEKFNFNEPYKEEAYTFDEPDIYKKIYELKLIEPNIFNRFKDYSYIAVDRYPEKRKTTLLEWREYQHEFITEFIRDILLFGGEGKVVPSYLTPILFKPTKRRRKRRL